MVDFPETARVYVIPRLSLFRCCFDAEQREPYDGPEDTAVLRPFYDVLLRGLRWYRPVQRGQAHDGRGLQQHAAHSRHGRIRVALRPGTAQQQRTKAAAVEAATNGLAIKLK